MTQFTDSARNHTATVTADANGNITRVEEAWTGAPNSWRFYSTYPAFAQEIGDSTFAVNTDDEIDLADATNGVVAAAGTIGVRFIEPKVAQAIRSGKYQSIVPGPPRRIVADRRDKL
jgi:hypothetical protein